MKTCPNCQANNPDTARTCRKCAMPLRTLQNTVIKNLKQKSVHNSKEINTTNTTKISPYSYQFGNIHPDLQGLIWFADGENKNYFPNSTFDFMVNGAYFKVSTSFSEEPSAIYTKMPISTLHNISSVPKLPYYPRYSSLSPEQKYVYLTMLSNPYIPFDIGYVFILYYGLERHLLYGNIDQAVSVIMKLRAVHDNSSFQTYSLRAVITSCVCREEYNLLNKFIRSLNDIKNIDFNIYMMLCLASNKGLTPEALIQFKKFFKFTNGRYISSDYDLFISMLIDVLNEEYNVSYLPLNNINTKLLPKEELLVFANTSFSKRSIKTICFKYYEPLIQAGFKALQTAHTKVKQYKAELRKYVK